MDNQAQKKDAGKTMWHLLPWRGTEDVIRVLEFGARKYSEGSWRSVDKAGTRYLNAALRHLIAHTCGEKVDPESGLPHLAHAACNLLFLLDLRSEIQS